MAPRRSEQNEAIRAGRRQQILGAAIPLFARQGFDATSVSQVAREAGVSHGTVFLYFPTKEDLFRAAVMEPLAEAERHYRGIVQGEGSPLARMKRMMGEQLRVIANQDHVLRLAYNVVGQRDRLPALVQEIYAFTGRYAEIVGALVAEGQRRGELGPGNPQAIAWAYLAYLNGVVLLADPPGSPYFEETLETFAQVGLRLFNPIREGTDDAGHLSG